jgi:hypothetical protein
MEAYGRLVISYVCLCKSRPLPWDDIHTGFIAECMRLSVCYKSDGGGSMSRDFGSWYGRECASSTLFSWQLLITALVRE